jgi:iron complex transport system substrate-binding protein
MITETEMLSCRHIGLSVFPKIAYNKALSLKKMKARNRTRCFLCFTLCLVASFSMARAAAPASQAPRMTFKDSLGRTVTIPAKAERILSLQPEITRIIVALGAGERLVGIDYFLRHDDRLFKIIYPQESRLPVVSRPDDSVNKELVVRLDPDVVFASPSEFQAPDSIQRNLGIPVVALSSLGHFDKLLGEIELVGAVTGLEDRSRELVAYFKEKVRPVSEHAASVPLEKKPRIYLSFWSSLTRTPVFYEPVNSAGGINLAENLLPSSLGSIQTVVTFEQIIKWNPEIILIQGNFPPEERMVTVKQVLEDRRLSSVEAVKNNQVYYTFGFWYWWDPAEVLVETLYLARMFYPEKFGRIDLAKEGEEIFTKFYREEGAFTALSKLLNFHEWTR